MLIRQALQFGKNKLGVESLFWRIFLWFWLAMVLIGTTLVVSTIVTQSESQDHRIRLMIQSVMPLQAQHAADLFEQVGPEKLSEYLRQIESSGPFHASLHRDSGANLLGGQDLKSTRDVIVRAAKSRQPQYGSGQASKLIAQPTTGPSGEKYVLCLEGRTPPLLGFLRGAPRAQFFRGCALLVVAAAVCFWLARYITTPLLRLQNASRRIAAGQLETRIFPEFGNRRDEIGRLGQDFDLMADRIDTLMTSQQRLLQAISHELRSPLARLNVALGLARQRDHSGVRNELDRIELEAERLNQMIAQVLTLTRMESSKLTSSSPFELSALISDVVDDAAFEARNTTHAIRLVYVEPCLMNGSVPLLRSAIENVVRNALRYTQESTTVEVSLVVESSSPNQFSAIVRVCDHGPGVPEDSLQHIFRPFYRVTDARERETGGTGLGLAITEHAVRLHGGDVRARNAKGGGLIVELSIPATSRVLSGVSGSPSVSQLPADSDLAKEGACGAGDVVLPQ